MRSDVLDILRFIIECDLAQFTHDTTGRCVTPLMCAKVGFNRKSFEAYFTHIRSQTSVASFVGVQTRFLCETFLADITFKWPLPCVCSHMYLKNEKVEMEDHLFQRNLLISIQFLPSLRLNTLQIVLFFRVSKNNTLSWGE